jgi:hypothetical protein
VGSSDPSCLTRRREGGLVTVVGAVVRVVGAVVRAVGEVVTVVGEVVLGSGEQGVAGESNISRWNSLLQVFAVEVLRRSFCSHEGSKSCGKLH